MEQKERKSDNIELRSEKVRNVIGKVPPRLISLGTVVITIIVLALAVAFYKIPYNASYNCNITSHKARLIHREDGNYFMAIATVSTLGQNIPILQKYMKADVRIIVSNKTLWQQVFG